MSEQKASIGQRVFYATVIVAIMHIVVRSLGLVQWRVISYSIGQGAELDIFTAAYSTILSALFYLFEEGFAPAFLPLFIQARKEDGEHAAWRFAGSVLVVLLFCVVGVIAVMILGGDSLIKSMWLLDWPSDKIARTGALARRMSPALLFLCAGTISYMALNGYKRFACAAFGDGGVRIGVISCSVVLSVLVVGRENIMSLMYLGVILGGVFKVCIHVFGMRKEFRMLRLNFDFFTPRMKRFAQLILPLMLGIIFAKFVRDAYISRAITTAQKDGYDGLYAAFMLGRKIPDVLVWLVPYALSLALLPFLTELSLERNYKRLGEILSQAVRIVLAFFIPLTAWLCAVSFSVACLFLSRANAPELTNQWLALSVGVHALMIPAMAIEMIMMQGYFADQRMSLPMILGIIFSIINIALAAYVVDVLALRGEVAMMGIIFAFIVSRTGKSLALTVILKHKVPMLPFGTTAFFFLKVICLSFIVGWSSYIAMNFAATVFPQSSMDSWFSESVQLWWGMQVVVGSICSLFVFILVAKLLRVEEVFEGVTMIKKRLKKSK